MTLRQTCLTILVGLTGCQLYPPAGDDALYLCDPQIPTGCAVGFTCTDVGERRVCVPNDEKIDGGVVAAPDGGDSSKDGGGGRGGPGPS